MFACYTSPTCIFVFYRSKICHARGESNDIIYFKKIQDKIHTGKRRDDCHWRNHIESWFWSICGVISPLNWHSKFRKSPIGSNLYILDHFESLLMLTSIINVFIPVVVKWWLDFIFVLKLIKLWFLSKILITEDNIDNINCIKYNSYVNEFNLPLYVYLSI